MSRTRAIILDLDGTLIDSSGGIIEAVNYSLRQMGEAEQAGDAIRPYIGYSLRTMYPAFTDAPYEQLRQHFQVKAAETVVSGTHPLPGAEQVLEALCIQGYRLAIASTKIRPHIEGIVERFGWNRWVNVLVGGDEVTNVKPAPEAVTLALSRLGAAADSAIMVGDTINDILAGRAAGTATIGVCSPYPERVPLLSAAPDLVIDSVADLPDAALRLIDGRRP